MLKNMTKTDSFIRIVIAMFFMIELYLHNLVYSNEPTKKFISEIDTLKDISEFEQNQINTTIDNEAEYSILLFW